MLLLNLLINSWFSKWLPEGISPYLLVGFFSTAIVDNGEENRAGRGCSWFILLLLNLIFQQFPLLLSYFYFLFLFEKLAIPFAVDLYAETISCLHFFLAVFISSSTKNYSLFILYQGPSKKASIAENNIELILGGFVLHEEGTKLFYSLMADASVC